LSSYPQIHEEMFVPSSFVREKGSLAFGEKKYSTKKFAR